MKVHVLRREQLVAAPRSEVFAFFARPENLAALTPRDLGFAILTPSPVAMRQGALIDYVIRLGPVPLRWRTLITSWEPPEKFVDEQLLGPYAFWHHTHTFAETAVGGTRLGDVVRYALPLGPLGSVAHALVVRRRLEGIFAHRRRAVADRFGTGKEQP